MTSEAYNNQIDPPRSRTESTYVPSSIKPAFNDLSESAHPSPQRTRASSSASATLAFATHFESDFSPEDVGGGSKQGDLMSWDDEGAPRRRITPPSQQPQQRYSSFAEEPKRSSFDDGHQFSNSSGPINTAAYPYQNYDSGSLTPSPSKKETRPFSTFLPRSSSFTSNSNHNFTAPPSPSYRNNPEPELQAEEDWGVLGEKARKGISRTRSGSGSQMLNAATHLDRTEEALERGDLGAEFRNVAGVVARGVAVFDFKGVEVSLGLFFFKAFPVASERITRRARRLTFLVRSFFLPPLPLSLSLPCSRSF